MSDPDLHARASALFVVIRELPPDERRRALGSSAQGDARLAEEVLSLLDHDVPATVPPAAAAPAAALDGLEHIGPYRLAGRIGRGSSGQVYLALQEEPIRRRVAIKIVPQAAASAELAARFDVERRALERTEHPNIARILDAGTTEGGLPYLVMEYVEGPAITAYCDRNRLPLAGRIRLMLDVASAVQHAHQCGVVHRDLKPANLLVATVQGRPIPSVLDFGIAKPVAGAFPEETPPTSGLPIGTPSYMAPEQTGLAAVDTRADVYSLGAVLYELVAGRPPIDGSGDPLEVWTRIRKEVPPPASRVRARSSYPGFQDRVSPSVLADLDAVLGKALEKSRDRRYATVEALAEDLRRLLRREPIEARAPTFGYRAARFVQRNRALVATASVVALASVLGLVGLFLGLVQAKRERREAVFQSESQREINRFLTDDLLARASPDREGAQVTVLELLHRASRTIDARFPSRPLVAASIHQALGDAYAELGDQDDAEHHVDQAIELRRAVAGADAPDTVRSEISRAGLIARREQYAEAEQPLRTAVDRARSILGTEDRDLYTALNDLGVTLESLGRASEAMPALEEALEGRRRLLGDRDRDVLTTMSNLALACDAAGDTDRSIALLREAVALVDSTPDAPRFTRLGLYNNLAATYQDLGRDAEAAPFLSTAAGLAAEALGPDHPGTLSIQANLAGLEAKLGDPARAAELYARVVARRTAVLGPRAPDTLTARHGWCDAQRLDCRFDEAAAGFGALLEDVESALGPDHPLAGQTELSFARTLWDAGRAPEALAHAEQAEVRLRLAYGEEHFRSRTARDLVDRIRAGAPGDD